LAFIKSVKPADIYCFQEFWFDPDYYNMFKDFFEPDFSLFSAKRPVRNSISKEKY
jgi:hypothetical protein